jgi:hypothetical protein
VVFVSLESDSSHHDVGVRDRLVVISFGVGVLRKGDPLVWIIVAHVQVLMFDGDLPQCDVMWSCFCARDILGDVRVLRMLQVPKANEV